MEVKKLLITALSLVAVSVAADPAPVADLSPLGRQLLYRTIKCSSGFY